MPQHLVSTILFDGTLSLEWEECLSAPDDRAITLQNLVFNNYKEKNAAGSMLWMFILGLSDSSVHLSASLSFWREFGATWIHQAQCLTDIEEKREKLSLFLQDEDTKRFIERLPEMVGSELVDTKTNLIIHLLF